MDHGHYHGFGRGFTYRVIYPSMLDAQVPEGGQQAVDNIGTQVVALEDMHEAVRRPIALDDIARRRDGEGDDAELGQVGLVFGPEILPPLDGSHLLAGHPEHVVGEGALLDAEQGQHGQQRRGLGGMVGAVLEEEGLEGARLGLLVAVEDGGAAVGGPFLRVGQVGDEHQRRVDQRVRELVSAGHAEGGAEGADEGAEGGVLGDGGGEGGGVDPVGAGTGGHVLLAGRHASNAAGARALLLLELGSRRQRRVEPMRLVGAPERFGQFGAALQVLDHSRLLVRRPFRHAMFARDTRVPLARVLVEVAPHLQPALVASARHDGATRHASAAWRRVESSRSFLVVTSKARVCVVVARVDKAGVDSTVFALAKETGQRHLPTGATSVPHVIRIHQPHPHVSLVHFHIICPPAHTIPPSDHTSARAAGLMMTWQRISTAMPLSEKARQIKLEDEDLEYDPTYIMPLAVVPRLNATAVMRAPRARVVEAESDDEEDLESDLTDTMSSDEDTEGSDGDIDLRNQDYSLCVYDSSELGGEETSEEATEPTYDLNSEASSRDFESDDDDDDFEPGEQTTGASFEDLPPEIRNKIYRLALVEPDPILAVCNPTYHPTRSNKCTLYSAASGIRNHATIRSLGPPMPAFPLQLLRTNKAVSHEASKVFYGSNSLVFWIGKAPFNYMDFFFGPIANDGPSRSTLPYMRNIKLIELADHDSIKEVTKRFKEAAKQARKAGETMALKKMYVRKLQWKKDQIVAELVPMLRALRKCQPDESLESSGVIDLVEFISWDRGASALQIRQANDRNKLIRKTLKVSLQAME
ncbi:hypothetical protein AC579_4884 [Pseudocercospora musae]|uniref:Uncharacterized protein n=1 Tax=Pseudocercospora musae TaxID=113226 RepID=A0A139IJV4_9PEZI|nr:hypothetical protein AC579_4884 [Pseudocercospora musae]